MMILEKTARSIQLQVSSSKGVEAGMKYIVFVGRAS